MTTSNGRWKLLPKRQELKKTGLIKILCSFYKNQKIRFFKFKSDFFSQKNLSNQVFFWIFIEFLYNSILSVITIMVIFIC